MKNQDLRDKKLSPNIRRTILDININFCVAFSRKCTSTSLFILFSHAKHTFYRVASHFKYPTTTTTTTTIYRLFIACSLACSKTQEPFQNLYIHNPLAPISIPIPFLYHFSDSIVISSSFTVKSLLASLPPLSQSKLLLR